MGKIIVPAGSSLYPWVVALRILFTLPPSDNRDRLEYFLETAAMSHDDAEEAKLALEAENTTEHRLDNYQHFLGRIADAAGCSGSPTLEEVLSRVANLRSYVEKQAGQDWLAEPNYIREAKEALGWRV